MLFVHLINQSSYQQFVIFPSGIVMFFCVFEMYLKNFLNYFCNIKEKED